MAEEQKQICGEPWLCPKGHVLGVSRQLVINERGRTWKVDVLYKLRCAIGRDWRDEKLQSVDAENVDCRMEGTVHDIRCSVCGEKRTWWQGQQSMQRLLTKVLNNGRS